MHARANIASRRPRGEAFPRACRVGARRDFRAAYEHGAKHHGRLVVVFAKPRAEGGPRLGLTATRKAGGAVVRNRARRRVREIFRRWAATAPEVSLDLIVNISEQATRAPFAALSSEVTALLARAAADVAK
ncbi:MAG: ribonuclease P protein component [Thermoanaerobaculia bacterium]